MQHLSARLFVATCGSGDIICRLLAEQKANILSWVLRWIWYEFIWVKCYDFIVYAELEVLGRAGMSIWTLQRSIWVSQPDFGAETWLFIHPP